MSKFDGLKPERVFYYFEKITEIPRCSYDEKRISDYLKSVGEDLGLETIQDDLLNIIIRKPASKGYEDSEGVIIQGHMDMVCEKEDDSNHDFTKDPIGLKVEGDFVLANKTTLGADNGIAVAMGLAIMEDKTLEHPSIELLVTIAEEVEMDGALGLSDSLLQGKRLLNVDSEEEGILVTGSAGGELIEARIPATYEAKTNYEALDLEVRGLFGGHSGMEIHQPRGNSIKILNDILEELKENFDIRLVSINGGTKDNAIPRQSVATIGVESQELSNLIQKMDEIKKKIIGKYKSDEPDIDIVYSKGEEVLKVMNKETLDHVNALLHNIPTGVYTMIPDNDKIVESSSNLAIVVTEEKDVVIQVSTRSSTKDILMKLREVIVHEIEKNNSKYSIGGEYPEWEYNPESPLRDKALKVYKDLTGEEMESTVIHAGLESGALAEKYPDLDIISFGPNMYDVHTPKERLSISSTEKTYEYLVRLLKELK